MTIYDAEFFTSGRSETATLSASIVAPVVKDLLSPTSLIDIGCGQGEWLNAFGLDDMLGVDIAAPEGEQFLRRDLSYPLALGRVFDLALCLETGEHLPASAADTLVDTITTHSDQVLFSAAVPGQEGKGHINCQPHEYWHEKFEARGYEMYDAIRPLIAREYRVSPWYRENIFVYRRAR